ncbi:uncharacterized protein [Leuresthes tenuis]|uniref:uncharacterized protein isoform X2 n=1 Tax=Leuresthes tenuis TaxID=355514 RepID=UPI003B514ECA
MFFPSFNREQDCGCLQLLSTYNMEVETCAVEGYHHAASLLGCLNFQRERAQYCDCVLRQKQSSGQLYPAHRCVLAASSPVLASLLSSTGALVELQDSCLSDSVLAPLLDYIYTGALPYPLNREQYPRLLTAACHLQMNELQDTLREAWRQTEINAADDASASDGAAIHPYKNINDTYKSDLKAFGDPSSSPSMDYFGRLEDTSKLCSARVEMFDKAQINSVSMDSSVTDGETDISKNDAKHCGRADASLLEYHDTVYGSDNRKVTYSTKRNLMQNIPGTDESPVNKEVHEDQFHSDGFIKPVVWPRSTEEELLITNEDRGSSSSLPNPCYGAVPVICHGSRAAVCQLAEVCPVPPYHPAFQSSLSTAPDSHSACTDGDNPCEGISSKHKNQFRAQIRDSNQNEKPIVCTSHHELNLDCSSSQTDQFMISKNIFTGKGLSHITVHNERLADCDSFQTNTKHLAEDLVPHNKDWSMDSFQSKHQLLSCFEYDNVSLATAKEEQSQDWKSAASLPTEDSDTGSDSQNVCFDVEAKEKHSSSFQCPTKMDIQDSNCNSIEPSCQHENDSNTRHTAMQHKEQRVDLCVPLSTILESGLDNVTECITFLKPKKISGSKIVEPLFHSDELSDEDKAGSFAVPGQSPPKRHSPTEITDQVLLVDTNPKAAEEKGVGLRNRTENAIKIQDKAQRCEEPSVTWTETKKIRKGAKFGTKTFDEKKSNEKTNVQERKFVGKDRNRRGAQITPKAKFIEVSHPNKGENKISTRPVCSTQSVPDSVQASMPSILSVCIPSKLSADMPTERSAHLSSPSHQPFQCSLCDRSFSQRGSLNRHVRSHLGVRPFPCPRCPMTFSRQYRVTEHMRVHQRCALGNDLQKPSDSSISDIEHN